MGFDNLIVALSNFTGLIAWPYLQTDYERFALLGAMISSFIYHLFEHQKHGMSGVKIDGIQYLGTQEWHFFLINVDRICATLAVLTFAKWQLFSDMTIVGIGILGLILVITCEMNLLNPAYKYHYIILHSGWHILAFYCIFLIKRDYP